MNFKQEVIKICLIKYSRKNDFGMGFVPSNTDIQQRILSYSLSAFDRTLYTVDGGYINLGLLFGPYITHYLFLIHYILSNEINSNTQKDFLIIYLLALFGINFTYLFILICSVS